MRSGRFLVHSPKDKMGFGSNTRRQLAADQRSMNQAMMETIRAMNARTEEYDKSRAKRLEGTQFVRDDALRFIKGLKAGTDIRDLAPELIKPLEASSDTIANSMRMAQNMGSRVMAGSAPAAFMAQLDAKTKSDLSKNLSRTVGDLVVAKQADSTNNVMNAEGLTNADYQAAFNMQGGVLGGQGQILGLLGNQYQNQLARQQAAISPFISLASGGLQGWLACVTGDTVIPTEDSFVTADRLRAGTVVRGLEDGEYTYSTVKAITPVRVNKTYLVKTENSEIKVSETHYFETDNGETRADQLDNTDKILGIFGYENIISITPNQEEETVYFIELENGTNYLSNGLVSIT